MSQHQGELMQIKNRIKELRQVKASELLPNPKNWRTHPVEQSNALRGVLSEIGYADALIAYETDNGLMLIDGHLRAETTPDMEVPVLVTDLSSEEADKLLATLDPLAAMANSDTQALLALVESLDIQNESIGSMLDSLKNNGQSPNFIEELAVDETNMLNSNFEVLVVCIDENQQRELLERFMKEGLQCRSLIS